MASATPTPPTLDTLPDMLLSLILKSLPGPRDMCAAIASHRSLAAAAALDADGIWRPLSAHWEWRLRRLRDESSYEFCKRGLTRVRSQHIVTIGGCDSDDDAEMCCSLYDVQANRWDGSPGPWPYDLKLPLPIDAPAAASDGDTICIVGGWDGPEYSALDAVFRLSVLDADEVPGWQTLASLREPRCFAGTEMDSAGRLWVAGGGDSIYQGATISAAVEVLHLEEGSAAESCTWRQAGEMIRPRCGLALCTDLRRPQLFAVGGYSGGNSYEQSVEAIDVHTGVSRLLPPMAVARSGPGATFNADGALYVMGGSRDGFVGCGSVERMDPRVGKWEALPNLPADRAYLSACSGLDAARSVFAVGGCDTVHAPCDSLYALDPRAAHWRELARMSSARANLASVVLC